MSGGAYFAVEHHIILHLSILADSIDASTPGSDVYASESS